MGVVDFEKISTVGLESSPHAQALAGLRANEARYFWNKYRHQFVTFPAAEVPQVVAYVAEVLREKDLEIVARPLEATIFQVEDISWAHVFYESGLAVNVLYALEAPGGAKPKRAVGFKLCQGMEIPAELAEKFKFARQRSKLAGEIRGSFFVINGEYPQPTISDGTLENQVAASDSAQTEAEKVTKHRATGKKNGKNQAQNPSDSEIIKKLRIADGMRVAVSGRPDESYFSQYPDFALEETDSAVPDSDRFDLLIAFVTDLDMLVRVVHTAWRRQVLASGGRLALAYAKKGNKRYRTFVHRDEIFPALRVNESDGYLPQTTYRFNQMIALDETFTVIGLKNDPTRRERSGNSQSVGDYAARVGELESMITQWGSDNDAELAGRAAEFLAGLTPGYQRNWARYVLSPKRPQTIAKRLEETIRLLAEGVKSK